jgi:hypothetical protein
MSCCPMNEQAQARRQSLRSLAVAIVDAGLKCARTRSIGGQGSTNHKGNHQRYFMPEKENPEFFTVSNTGEEWLGGGVSERKGQLRRTQQAEFGSKKTKAKARPISLVDDEYPVPRCLKWQMAGGLSAELPTPRTSSRTCRCRPPPIF